MEYILMGLMYVGGLAVMAVIMISLLEIIIARHKRGLLVLEQPHLNKPEQPTSGDKPDNVYYLKNEFTFNEHFGNKK